MTINNERLQKVIAQSGITSRRKAEQLIVDGRVKVNGKVIKKLGTKVNKNDRIEVDHVPITKEELVYYLLYKPRRFISSVKDDRGRKTVTELVPNTDKRVFPIGRLDYDTSGLILLTNDGELAQLLMHPSHQIDKVYVAKIKGIPSKAVLTLFKKGILSKGEKLKATQVKLLSANKQKNTSVIEITLHEGKNRQVRRMFEEIGFPVLKLKRERYSFLDLTGLQPGDYRELTRLEIQKLRDDAMKKN
ncbi:rRNA pseudouridine synthase [Amphibacillus sp. MSJ-3]|uniref:pseudouridine synthase n=1 Tax=Amphibacillus sp. MSJ-3 TaxID=2841505 RepID=UPI001C0EBCB6|nr:pseudouridine synthase [Amphibacillus sp. MSJ-3]MBU5594262.1 rRNA pseudouridine synthase [Amphibacillus sp. MSJ-3]